MLLYADEIISYQKPPKVPANPAHSLSREWYSFNATVKLMQNIWT